MATRISSIEQGGIALLNAQDKRDPYKVIAEIEALLTGGREARLAPVAFPDSAFVPATLESALKSGNTRRYTPIGSILR